LKELAPGCFVSDFILMDVLNEEITSPCYTFDSNLMKCLMENNGKHFIKSQTGKMPADTSIALFPTHLPNHWILVVVNMKSLEIELWDSLGSSSKNVQKQILEAITHWFAVYNDIIDPKCDLTQPTQNQMLQSEGSNNCAMFVILIAVKKAAGLPNEEILKTSCQEATELRKKILEIYY
jgi:hypothetical protein